MRQVIRRSMASAKPDAIVSFDDVTRRFGDVTAIERLSFEIGRGETVALLGPNGAGKTTATEILLSLREPDAGDVRLYGRAPSDAIARGRVGAMLQDAGVPQGVTVAELVDLIRALYPDPLSREAALRLSDLEGVAGRRVERLSGGQRQRVRLALALAGDPELLVLDEPTGALDVAARRGFWDRVRASAGQGRTVLFATHRLEEADQVADRVLVLVEGRLVADGTPNQMKAAVGRSVVSFTADGLSAEVVGRLPAVESVEAGRKRVTLYTTDPDLTVRALLQQAPRIADLQISSAGLEDAFLSLTGEGGS
ncbi:MAG: ABC transporter ATP-binding protein [Actinomycetota bacterium]